jgi:hypothetical protein
VCAAGPRPVLPHCAGHQLVSPPLLPMLVGVQRPMQRCFNMLGLAAAADVTKKSDRHSTQSEYISGATHQQTCTGQLILPKEVLVV